MTDKRVNWWELFRLITPLMITVGLFMIGNINTKIDCLDQKVFTHLTNHDIHIPRETIVNKGEFELINNIRATQFAKIESALSELRAMIIENMKK